MAAKLEDQWGLGLNSWYLGYGLRAGWLVFIALWLWSEPAYERLKGKQPQ